MNRRSVFELLALIVWFGSAITVLGNGFLLPDQDAFATARGEAFAATADNPSAIYYNPAGITQLDGNNLRLGVYSVDLDPRYTPPGGNRTFHNQDKLHAVPQFYFTSRRSDWPVCFGLGVYSPFGLGVRWPQDTGFRTLGTQSSLQYTTINPVMGLKLSPVFSIAGGVTINYACVDLRQGLFSADQPTDGFRFEGDGWGVGYNLGALWQPHRKVTLGVTFRSGTSIDLHGHASAFNNSPPFPVFSQNPSAHANFSFPLQAIFGISFRPTPNWNLEFDADYTDWNTENTVTIQQPGSVVLPQNVPLTLKWQSSWLYEFGATRYLGRGWHVSAGYAYNENSMPDAHYTPLVADQDRHFFSVGAGAKWDLFDFDIAYQFGYGPRRTVVGSAPSLTGQTADGSYEYISHALLLAVGVHF